MTKEALIQQYSNYSDEELYALYLNTSGYTQTAQEAVDAAIELRGGPDAVAARLQEKMVLQMEVSRIERETAELSRSGFDIAFIRQGITSTLLNETQLRQIIEQQTALVQAEEADKAVTAVTIRKSIAGGAIAVFAGGIAWGLIAMLTQAFSPLLFVGMLLLCYAIIKLFTRQSGRNIAVIITTIIATFLAFGLGTLLYSIIGPVL